jgi:ribosomal protein S18 acetylase RimI-like enzyme
MAGVHVQKGIRQLTSKADLIRLANWLETGQHPGAFRVLGHLRSNINGILRTDVFTNSWPKPTVVLLKPRAPTSHGYVNNVCSVFATDIDDCRETLLHADVMDWTQPWGIGGMDTRLNKPLADLARSRGGRLEPDSGPCLIFHIPKRRLQDIKADLPVGYYESKLTELHASLVTATWPHLAHDTEEFVRYLLHNLPSTCVRIAATGQMVGWTVAQHYRCIGMMHVVSAHRNKGIGRYLTKRAAEDLVYGGSPAYSYVLRSNTVAQSMLRKMDFEVVEDMDSVWVSYHPPPQQQRMIGSA